VETSPGTGGQQRILPQKKNEYPRGRESKTRVGGKKKIIPLARNLWQVCRSKKPSGPGPRRYTPLGGARHQNKFGIGLGGEKRGKKKGWGYQIKVTTSDQDHTTLGV